MLLMKIAVPMVAALDVINVVDSIIVQPGEYFRLNSMNDANFVSQESKAFEQNIKIKISNAYENF